MLKRPAGRPPTHVRRICGDFAYQAASRDKPSWDKSWRVVARVERHWGDLFPKIDFPKIGFVVTNPPMEPDRIIRFYNQRGTAEQHVEEGRKVINRTRLSCKGMAWNEVRLQLHALACNPGVFLQGADLPEEMADRSPTGLRTRLIRIGARVVRHARAVTFQPAEAVPASSAALVTPTIFSVTSFVPVAASCTLWDISLVVAACSSMAAATTAAVSLTWRMTFPISAMETTASLVAVWISSIC